MSNAQLRLQKVRTNMSELSLPDGSAVLFSFETPVAMKTPRGYYRKTDRFHSQATSRHIYWWLDGAGEVASETKVIPQDQLNDLVRLIAIWECE
tara:strand:+ start:173 stop:454 length:282 start_codon:yes stop_codon:yes gene_type:complete